MAGVQAASNQGVKAMAKSLSHTKWMCKYHIIFTPKYRRKIIYNKYKASIVEILKDLCQWKGVEIIEGKAMMDHVHLLVSIPPKISMSSFMGYLKGKSALMIFDRHANLKYKYGNRHFWSRGYYVSTVGLNEATSAKYVREQEKHDQMMDRITTKEPGRPVMSTILCKQP
jgi:putative transposase